VKRLVVIGAGIAGLGAARAAWEARGRVPGGLEVLVLERERRVGGKAVTRRQDGWLFETGPGAIQGSEPELDRLVRAAGLEAARLASAPAASRRFLYRAGRLREVPLHPLAFLRSGLLSPLGLLRLACEPLVPVRRDGPEESVHGFAARRVGEQAARRLVGPIVTGVYAGDPERLSLPAAFPRMAELEGRYGGLIRGMRALARRPPGPDGERRGPAGAGLSSFPEGLSQLALALCERSGFAVRTGARAAAVLRAPGAPGVSARPGAPIGWRVALESGEALQADAVVLAGEAWSMAGLLQESAPELAGLLGAVRHPPVAVVGLGYAPPDAARAPSGFGALVARGEPVRLLGCLWDSAVFPGRAPEGHLFVRCLYGGVLDPQAAHRSEGELVAAARADLGLLLGITGTPQYSSVAHWERAIPQYELGHLERRRRLAEQLAACPGLHVCGNHLDGVAFPKAAASGVAAGERAVRELELPTR